MNTKIRDNIIPGLSAFTALFPLSLAMGVCSGFGIYSGVISLVISSLLAAFIKSPVFFAPSYLIFLLFTFTGAFCGNGLAFFSLFL